MLTAPTVFVLGAGAGCDVGMPLGDELSGRIANKLDLRYEGGFRRVSGDPKIEAALKRYARNREGDYNDWRAAGVQIKDGIDYTRSIDNYLYAHSDNEKLAVCAKMGILRTIIEFEKRSALCRVHRGMSTSFNDRDTAKSSWLGDLLNVLVERIVIRESLRDIFNNLSIINFNYDRCVEHFLFHAIRDWSQQPEHKIIDLMKELKIFHPYGTVGVLPWQHTSNASATVEFGGTEYGDHLDELVENIRTYHEQIEQGEELNAMRHELRKANNVVFLGCHFHEQNMNLLCIPGPRQNLARVYATVLHRPGTEVEMVRKRIKTALLMNSAQADNAIKTLDGDCKALFREYRVLWMN